MRHERSVPEDEKTRKPSRTDRRRTEPAGPGFRSTPADVLQQTVGNQAVKRLFESGELQARLVVSRPTDPSEREARRVAERVMRTEGPAERISDPGDDERSVNGRDARTLPVPITRSATAAAVTAVPESTVEVGFEGGGEPLPRTTRSGFEARFGTDLSGVRVHTGPAASEAAGAISAEAFTLGTDIAFAGGNYDPTSREGRELLAHELVHVVQQAGTGGTRTINREDADPKETAASSSEKGGTESGDGTEAEKDIDARVDGFVDDMNRRLDAIRRGYIAARRASRTASDAASGDGNGPSGEAGTESVPALRVRKKAPERSRRTAAQQAQAVVKGTSWTCRSAHLVDKARHVWLLVGGKIAWKPETELTKTFNRSVRDRFVRAWTELMARHGLKNYKAGDGWAPGDAFHLEMPKGRAGGAVVRRCVREYVRLTRVEGKPRNDSFERTYASQIARAERRAAVERARKGVRGAVGEAERTPPGETD